MFLKIIWLLLLLIYAFVLICKKWDHTLLYPNHVSMIYFAVVVVITVPYKHNVLILTLPFCYHWPAAGCAQIEIYLKLASSEQMILSKYSGCSLGHPPKDHVPVMDRKVLSSAYTLDIAMMFLVWIVSEKHIMWTSLDFSHVIATNISFSSVTDVLGHSDFLCITHQTCAAKFIPFLINCLP